MSTIAPLHYVDFDGLRPGPRFRDLPLGRYGITALRVDLPSARDVVEVSGLRYVAHMVHGLRRTPDTLVGFCAGAPIAHCMARMLQDRGDPVGTLILIDPVECSSTTVDRQYGQLLDRLGAKPAAFRTVREVVRAFDDGYSRFLAGLPPEDAALLAAERSQTVERYSEWIAFLVAASASCQVVSDHTAHVLLSAQAPTIPVWVRQRGRTVRLSVDQDDLLATPEAADVIAELAGPGPLLLRQ